MNPNEIYKSLFKEYADVVSVEQMCEMLGGMSTKTAYRLLRSGSIKSILAGRRYRIPKVYILEYLQVIQKSTS